MQHLSVHADRGAVTPASGNRGPSGIFTRICLPVILWVLVGIAAPAFVTDLYRTRRDIQEDFAVYYVLGQELRHGIDPYTTDFTKPARLHGFNIHAVRHGSEPPTFIALVCDPLSRMPIPAAYWLWQFTNLGCLVVAVYLLIGPGSGLMPWTGMSVVALTALYPPVVTHIWMGQSKLPALLLLVLAMRWVQHRRDCRAGFTLAFAALLRIFPFAFGGYLLLQQRWRVLLYTAIGLAIGGAVTVALVGIHNCISFVTAAALLVDQSWTDTARDISIDTFISRQLRAVLPNSPYLVAEAGRALNLTAKLLLVLITARATLAQPAGKDPDSRIYSLWVVTSIVLLPVVWDYDLTLFLIPFGIVAVVAARGDASRRTVAMAVVSYILMIFWDYLTPTRFEAGFLSMMTAYVSAYWLAIDQPAAMKLPISSIPAGIWRRAVSAGY